jgi:hypothetical protein
MKSKFSQLLGLILLAVALTLTSTAQTPTPRQFKFDVYTEWYNSDNAPGSIKGTRILRVVTAQDGTKTYVLFADVPGEKPPGVKYEYIMKAPFDEGTFVVQFYGHDLSVSDYSDPLVLKPLTAPTGFKAKPTGLWTSPIK